MMSVYDTRQQQLYYGFSYTDKKCTCYNFML